MKVRLRSIFWPSFSSTPTPCNSRGVTSAGPACALSAGTLRESRGGERDQENEGSGMGISGPALLMQPEADGVAGVAEVAAGAPGAGAAPGAPGAAGGSGGAAAPPALPLSPDRSWCCRPRLPPANSAATRSIARSIGIRTTPFSLSMKAVLVKVLVLAGVHRLQFLAGDAGVLL